MEGTIYLPLVEDMVWSYSRLGAFEDCPYKFYLKYLYGGVKEEKKFFSDYGSFIHKLIEKYYKGKLSKDEMLVEYITKFTDKVKGERPSEKIFKSYFDSGVEYLTNFKEFPYETIAIEKNFVTEVNGRKVQGVIDYIGKDQNGGIVIIDHKSANLKPRSNRKTATINDQKLDEMLRQLYIYSKYILEEYGKYPIKLCFNCFRVGNFIEEEFNEEKYKEALEWIGKVIKEIEVTENFYPRLDAFSCKYICGLTNDCDYYEWAKETNSL